MCGRFAIDSHVNDAITEYVHAGGNPQDWRPTDWAPNYNVAPTNPSVIIRDRIDHDSGELRREVDWDAVWDFRPTWLKTPAPQINARIENLTSSNLWKKSFIGRRAIVPMLGYYEWKTIAEKKQPYFIHTDGADFLSAAAIYIPVKTGEEWTVRFAIITREARDASGEIHDRMPAFLTPDTWDTWLAPEDITDLTQALKMLKASSEEVAASITTYPVSRALNNVRARESWDDPTLLERVEPVEQ
jgi:putative SOS response-associated peptidase YedK